MIVKIRLYGGLAHLCTEICTEFRTNDHFLDKMQHKKTRACEHERVLVFIAFFG